MDKDIEQNNLMEVNTDIIRVIGDLYYAIYYLSLSNNTFLCFRDDNNAVTRVIGVSGTYSSGWSSYVDQFVLDEYKDQLFILSDQKILMQKLQKVDILTLRYERKQLGWVKAQFIVSERDEHGNAINVVLTITDINDEVRNEQQRKEAQFEAEHDPLTGLYNRKGFDRISKSKDFQQNKAGFMLIDIDNFKVINDSYGHELGDQVLVSVAKKLKHSFRNEDKIFRLGGDELAILLYKCDASIWNNICSKLSMIHASLEKEFSEGLNVTLSVGVYFSEKGYEKEMYTLADKALYITKQNGRAGCTMIGKDHKVLESWSDSVISFEPDHIFAHYTTGRFHRDQELINAAMSSMYFAAYYWDLEQDAYATIKPSANESYITMGEQKTSKKIEEFISYVVDQSDRQRMRVFLNSDTMQERLENKTYIACKYRSISLEDWTQARLIPVKYNADGKLTHVLLVILLLNAANEKTYLADVDKRSLSFLYNNVPAGIVMYEWNGKQLKTIHISEYYAKEYGYTLNSEEGDNKGGPDFKRVHPDDLEGYQNAINEALAHTNKLQYIYRVWNQKQKRYLWVKVDAVAKKHRDGTALVYAVYTDISEQKVAEQRLEKSNAAILSALEATEQYIYEYDPVKHTSTCFTDGDNGYHLDHVIENYPECFRDSGFIYPDDVQMFIDTVHKIDQGEKTAHCEIRVKKETEDHWHSCTFNSFYDAEKGYDIALLTIIDVTLNKTMLQKHVRLMEKWKYESEHDRLTGLLNREALFQKCKKLLETHPDEQFVMLHCDIRHFHLYNTFYGEEAGDELLCRIAELISCMDRDYEYWAYGRIESDVFCAFFPIGPGHFEKHVRYFLKELETYREDFLITPAIGVYWVEDPSMSVEAMFSRATIAAKSGKTNLFHLISRYDESMDQNLKDTQMVTSEMNTAISEEQFQVYLQPKYSLNSEKIIGSEALARWMHPQRGMISPGKFIPVFEKNGFIVDLDRYMWEHVCQIIRKWLNEGKTVYPVSVNISRVSMYSRETVPFLIHLIQKYDLDPKYLELELTESAYMDDPEDLKRMLEELRTFGFKILIDDFGSGYSSLNTLRELPVDVLKLDMKFLSDSQNDKRGEAVLASIVRMSKGLCLPIIAEGVEKDSQANYLRDIGCEYAQGFLFARPMTVTEYEELLDKE